MTQAALVTSSAWCGFAALILWITHALAEAEFKAAVTRWALVGLGLAVLKSLLILQTSQWSDVPPDSRIFQLHAEALRLHWMGLPVDPDDYKLTGYLNSWRTYLGPHWMPDAPLQYVGVLGTHEWLYTAFLAVWQSLGEGWAFWATMGNAAMAGALPSFTYLVVRHLGASARIGHLGAVLVALDPSIAVNSTWLIKDTLAAFVAMAGVVLIGRLFRRPHWVLAVALALVLGLLAGIRFVAYAAFLIALLGLTPMFLSTREGPSVRAIGLAILLSTFVWASIYTAPQPLTPGGWIDALENPLHAQADTLHADVGELGADESVAAWKSYLQDKPEWAPLRSALRTLMAPYPWVALTHGLSGDNHIELYLPGTVLWILSLPAILLGMLTAARQAGPKAWVLLIVLALIAGAYITFFGEWSTRQRIFMLPLFFAFAAIGWDKLWRLTR